MAEDTGQERTEEPTEKRLREAREKGDIPRSRELSTTMLLMAAAICAFVFGHSLIVAMMGIMKDNFHLDREALFDPSKMISHLVNSVGDGFLALTGIVGVLTFAAIASTIVIGGWNFSNEAMIPKGSRINPLSGLKRMFSLNSLMELLKAIAKFSVVGFIAFGVLWAERDQLMALALLPIESAMAQALHILMWSFLFMSSAMILVAMVDVPFQIYRYRKKLMMTLQEIKDEMKNTEGKPEVKGRIRQLQREVSRRRMMKDVPQADVVITNPTHFSVAIQYDQDAAGGAPKVVAKGTDFIALKIREIAKEHDVPIIESPALARAIYFSTEIGFEVPVGLYKSVAQVLAYIFQLRDYHKNHDGDEPLPPSEEEIEIPNELRVDPE